MNDAKLYSEFSNYQQRDAGLVLGTLIKIVLYKKLTTCNKVLDIGCGPGDTTVDQVLPIFDQSCSKIVGTDKSDEMISYARKKYENRFLKFGVFDIEKDSLHHHSLLNKNSFDLVVSSYCYNWIRYERFVLLNC